MKLTNMKKKLLIAALLLGNAITLGAPVASQAQSPKLLDQMSALQRKMERVVKNTDALVAEVSRPGIDDFTYPKGEPPRFDCYCDPLDPSDPGSCTCDGLIDCIGMLVSNSCKGDIDCDSDGCGCTFKGCNGN